MVSHLKCFFCIVLDIIRLFFSYVCLEFILLKRYEYSFIMFTQIVVDEFRELLWSSILFWEIVKDNTGVEWVLCLPFYLFFFCHFLSFCCRDQTEKMSIMLTWNRFFSLLFFDSLFWETLRNLCVVENVFVIGVTMATYTWFWLNTFFILCLVVNIKRLNLIFWFIETWVILVATIY